MGRGGGGSGEGGDVVLFSGAARTGARGRAANP